LEEFMANFRAGSALDRRQFVMAAAGTLGGVGSLALPRTTSATVSPSGLDYEPSTITDFRGSTAVAYHVGSVRASDGRTYDLETDIRAYEGEYAVDGTVHHGSFAFV
jgi:hypothetical protein